jgi:hypothetical protein
MLILLDYFLSFLHLALIGFNLFGWIPKRTRKAHLITISLTAASWFILGIWYGIGYCPITDWQWDVKEKLGETGLPSSFIKYFADKITGSDIPASTVNAATLAGFIFAVVATVWVNFKAHRSSLPAKGRRR